MKRVAVLLGLIPPLLLSACASAPPLRRAESYEGRPEKAMLAVLRTVKADDAQRAAILEAFDRHNPKLLKLADDWQQVEQEWTGLDRKAPAFTDQVKALADRRQQIATQQLVEGAEFEREVAAVLSAEQWKDWEELWAMVGAPEGLCGPGGPGGGGRRRR